MGELLYVLLTHPEARIDDENYKHLIYLHEVIHTFLNLAKLGDTDDKVNELLTQIKP